MTIITTTKVHKDSRDLMYRKDIMIDRKTLIIPPDGGGSYLKTSTYPKTVTTTKLSSTKVQQVFDSATRRKDTEFWAKASLGLRLPDLPYNRYGFQKYADKYWFKFPLSPTGTSAYDYTALRREFDAEFFLPNGPGHTWNLLSQDHVAQRLLSKSKEATWSAPVSVLEARSTALMVANRASDLVRLLRLLKQGRIDSFLNGLRTALKSRERDALTRAYNDDFGKPNGGNLVAAARVWNETTLGWRPFVSDVYNAVETLGEALDKPLNRIGRVSTRLGARAQLRDTQAHNNPMPPGNWQRVIDYEESRNGVWHWQPRQDSYLLGKLGVTNPLLIGWELLPFSFLADWVFPIGAYLDTLDVPILVKHVGGTWGLRRETRYTLTIKGSGGSRGGSGTTHYWGIARTPITATPHVGLDFFRFEPKIGAHKAVTAIALLAQELEPLDSVDPKRYGGESQARREFYERRRRRRRRN